MNSAERHFGLHSRQEEAAELGSKQGGSGFDSKQDQAEENSKEASSIQKKNAQNYCNESIAICSYLGLFRPSQHSPSFCVLHLFLSRLLTPVFHQAFSVEGWGVWDFCPSTGH